MSIPGMGMASAAALAAAAVGARGPVDATTVPRFAGPATFARLPTLEEVGRADVAVLGIPFDAGTTFRPGARFGPQHVRTSSKLLRPYNPVLDVAPFAVQQVVDAGDIACNPFDIADAVCQLEVRVNIDGFREPEHVPGRRCRWVLRLPRTWSRPRRSADL